MDEAKKIYGTRQAEDAETGRTLRTELTPEEARQGRIVLTSAMRRLIFFGGLVALVLLASVGGWLLATAP